MTKEECKAMTQFGSYVVKKSRSHELAQPRKFANKEESRAFLAEMQEKYNIKLGEVDKRRVNPYVENEFTFRTPMNSKGE